MAHPRFDRPAVPRFGLIGCGRIGSLYDEGAPTGPALSLAGAMGRSEMAVLSAVCDQDRDRATTCARVRGVEAIYSDFGAMLADARLDAIAIATPPGQRLEIIDTALAAGIGLIWCEKPIAASLDEAREIARLVAGRDVVFAVNYLRRWAPAVAHVGRMIDAGVLGAAQTASLIYCKGIANNGSHFIDLMARFFGAARTMAPGRVLDDGRQDHDPTLDGVIGFDGGNGEFPCHLIGLDDRHYSLCELDILMTGGRIRFADWGHSVEIHEARPDPLVAGYTSLVLKERIEGALDDALDQALAQIVAVYHGRQAKPLCTIDDAIAALSAVEALLNPRL